MIQSRRTIQSWYNHDTITVNDTITPNKKCFCNCKFKRQKFRTPLLIQQSRIEMACQTQWQTKNRKMPWKGNLLLIKFKNTNQDQTFFFYQLISLGIVSDSIPLDLLGSHLETLDQLSRFLYLICCQKDLNCIKSCWFKVVRLLL